MGWGNAVEKVSGILDGLFGLSPEQKKVKLRNKIDKLERERNEILKTSPTEKTAHRITAIDADIIRLRKELGNR